MRGYWINHLDDLYTQDREIISIGRSNNMIAAIIGISSTFTRDLKNLHNTLFRLFLYIFISEVVYEDETTI
jgi:hypothetical protein